MLTQLGKEHVSPPAKGKSSRAQTVCTPDSRSFHTLVVSGRANVHNKCLHIPKAILVLGPHMGHSAAQQAVTQMPASYTTATEALLSAEDGDVM